MTRVRYPRRTISLGPPYDDGTPADPPPTRVQFGSGEVYIIPEPGPLTLDLLASLLHDNAVGCYEDDRCLEPQHRFKPNGNVHTFDAASLLPHLQPFLHKRSPGIE